MNVILSVVFGKYVFTSHPAIGVAIGTSLTDLLIVIFMVTISWKYSKSAIFNWNSFKIFIVTIFICALTFFIKDPVFNAIYAAGQSTVQALSLELVIVVLVDAIIYIGVLLLLKERVMTSVFVKKREK